MDRQPKMEKKSTMDRYMAMCAESDASVAKAKETCSTNTGLGSVADHQKGLEESLALEQEYDALSKKVCNASGEIMVKRLQAKDTKCQMRNMAMDAIAEDDN